MNFDETTLFDEWTLNEMYEKEKDLPEYMREMLPQYNNIELYTGKVAEYFNIVTREETYGSSDLDTFVEKNIETKEFDWAFLVPFHPQTVCNAIFSREKLIKILKKGFKKKTYAKEIAVKIYRAIEKDEGDYHGVEVYVDSYGTTSVMRIN